MRTVCAWTTPGPLCPGPRANCLCPGSALANERVQTNAAGQVARKLKTPWRDGTTHLVMSPLEFMQGLAALVPRPLQGASGQRPDSSPGTNSPLDCLCPGSAAAPHPFWCPLREHAVLAPNAKLRALVVPQNPEPPAQAAQPAQCG